MDFSEKSLVSANLSNADLTDANLVGATFFAAKPWKALLEKKTGQVSTGNANAVRCSNMGNICGAEKIFGVIRDVNGKLEECNKSSCDVKLYFRGQVKNWTVVPPVQRSENGYGRHEGEMLSELITRRPGDFTNHKSAMSQLVFAQHHRLHTRLLDITRNPAVALFFACYEDPYKKCFEREDGQLDVFAVPKKNDQGVRQRLSVYCCEFQQIGTHSTTHTVRMQRQRRRGL